MVDEVKKAEIKPNFWRLYNNRKDTPESQKSMRENSLQWPTDDTIYLFIYLKKITKDTVNL